MFKSRPTISALLMLFTAAFFAGPVQNASGAQVVLPLVAFINEAAPSTALTSTVPAGQAGPIPMATQPDLAPYAFPGWSNPVVPSSVTGTTVTGTLYAYQSAYVDWAVVNWGLTTNATFTTCLYLDGTQLACWNTGGLQQSYATYIYDYATSTSLAPGNHVLRVTVDTTNAVAEENESNNSWEGTFTWLENCPASSFSMPLDQLGGMIMNDALPRDIETEQKITAEHLLQINSMLTSYAPTYYDTSTFLTDKIAVGIIFPESNGSLDPNTEDWTAFEMNCVVSKIQTGLEWWMNRGGAGANLSFVFDPHKVATKYEPINRSNTEVGLWMSETMTNLGYGGSNSLYQTYDYAAYLRNHYNAQWAVVYYVADSSNDLDGKFANSQYFAFARLGGPYIVMTFKNDGWGIDDMNWVAAHEFGHSFWAGDQYYQADYGGCTSTTQRYGYLGVANSNCQYENPLSVPSLMRSNENALDASAAGQVGWKDSNANAIYDVVDTNPVFNIPAHTPDPTTETSWNYTGEVYDQPWPHGVCSWNDICVDYDVTINTIDSASFRIDGGAWNPVTPVDGTFDSASEEISFSTPTLAPGAHTIEVKATNSRGNTSSTYWSDTVTVRGCLTLSITVNPAYAGSVSATAPNCGSQYTYGTVVTLTAQPYSAFTFGNWSGDASGTLATTTVKMLANRAVTANFNNKSPTLASINPTNSTAGSSTFTLTLTGTNFVPDSVVLWNGGNLATTYGSAASLTASVPAANIVTGGTVTVTVYNPAPGGGTSNGQTFTINNPLPTLSSINPASVTAGGSTFTLSVTGSSFVSTSKVRWNGVDLPTTYVSATSLTADVPAANIAAAGSAAVTVFNPTPGGGTSAQLAFSINNPAPVLTSINPSSAIAAGTAFSLTVTGSSFVPTSKVRWNGADLPTTFGSATSLTASVPAGNIAAAGSVLVTVYTPTPGGGTSASQTFAINNPTPTMTSINPASKTAGGSTFTLTVTGSNFTASSVVRWNGVSLTTTYVGTTSLNASIPAANISATGTASITVINPAPGGGTSSALTFTIDNPPPTLTSIDPISTTAGGSDFSLIVTGSNFTTESQVRWDGADLATIYVSATSLKASVPAASVAAGGVFPVIVFTPTPGGGTSTAINFTVNNPSPTITSTSPDFAIVGSDSFTLTVYGTGFVNGTVVRWNGENLQTTYMNTNTLTAEIPESNLISTGSAYVSVWNPAPGGGASGEVQVKIGGHMLFLAIIVK